MYLNEHGKKALKARLDECDAGHHSLDAWVQHVESALENRSTGESRSVELTRLKTANGSVAHFEVDESMLELLEFRFLIGADVRAYGNVTIMAPSLDLATEKAMRQDFELVAEEVDTTHLMSVAALEIRDEDGEIVSDGMFDVPDGEWVTPHHRDQIPTEMLDVLKAFRVEFGDLIEGDEPIPGTYAVDAVCRLWPAVKAVLDKVEGRANA